MELGDALADRGDIEEAKEQYDTALKLAPDDDHIRELYEFLPPDLKSGRGR